MGNQRHDDLFELVLTLEETNTWDEVYDKILGLNGAVFQWEAEAQKEFWGSQCHTEILLVLCRMREAHKPQDTAQRMITVRVPKCVHESMKAEAHAHRTSMNQLCISKLLQPIDDELVPCDTSANHSTRRAKVDVSTS